jgi:hypothetical protein
MLRCGVALRKFRPSATTVLAVAVLALLPVLATAQYRWLGQISENERGRLQHALLNAMSGVARDLDTEVAGAVSQVDLEALASGRPVTSPSPLIRSVLYIPRGASQDAGLPPELTGMSEDIARVVRSGSSHDVERLSRIVRTPRGDQPVIAVATGEGNSYHEWRPADGSRSEHDHGNGVPGVALLLLDDQYLRHELAPRIVERYFGPSADSDFRVAIVNRETPGTSCTSIGTHRWTTSSRSLKAGKRWLRFAPAPAAIAGRARKARATSG